MPHCIDRLILNHIILIFSGSQQAIEVETFLWFTPDVCSLFVLILFEYEIVLIFISNCQLTALAFSMVDKWLLCNNSELQFNF